MMEDMEHSSQCKILVLQQLSIYNWSHTCNFIEGKKYIKKKEKEHSPG